jgi:hypothetical protein
MFQGRGVRRAVCILAVATLAATLAGGPYQSAGAAPAPPSALSPIIGLWHNSHNGEFQAVSVGKGDYAFVAVGAFKPPSSTCTIPSGPTSPIWAIVAEKSATTYPGKAGVYASNTKYCFADAIVNMTATLKKNSLTISSGPTKFRRVLPS